MGGVREAASKVTPTFVVSYWG